MRLMREVEIEGEKGSPNGGPEDLCRRSGAQYQHRRADRERQRRLCDDRLPHLRRLCRLQYQDPKRGTFNNASGIAPLGKSAGHAQPQHVRHARARRVFLRLNHREDRADDKYKIHEGRVHDLRAAGATVGGHQGTSATVNLGRLRDDAKRRRAGEGCAGLLSAGALLSDPGEDRATGFLIPSGLVRHIPGRSLSNAFFWAIDAARTPTFIHDWFLEEGRARAPSTRYLASPGRRELPFLFAEGDRGLVRAQRRPEVPSARRRSYEIHRRPVPGAAAPHAGGRNASTPSRRQGAAEVPTTISRTRRAARARTAAVSGAPGSALAVSVQLTSALRILFYQHIDSGVKG